MFCKGGFDGLEEADFVAECDRGIFCGAKGKCLGEFGDCLDISLHAILILGVRAQNLSNLGQCRCANRAHRSLLATYRGR